MSNNELKTDIRPSETSSSEEAKFDVTKISTSITNSEINHYKTTKKTATLTTSKDSSILTTSGTYTEATHIFTSSSTSTSDSFVTEYKGGSGKNTPVLSCMFILFISYVLTL